MIGDEMANTTRPIRASRAGKEHIGQGSTIEYKVQSGNRFCLRIFCASERATSSACRERVRGIFPSFADLERQPLIYSWAAPREREIGVENALGSVAAPSNCGGTGATKNLSGAATEAAPATWHIGN
jgi:hypothetical protein